MATSGDITGNRTARQLITYALRLINVTAQSETPSADDSARGLVELDQMLKGWQRYEHIWRLTEGYITLVANTAAYSLTPRPYRIIDCRYRDSNSIDTIMTPMSRTEYFTLPDKTVTGTPTQWWADYQRDTDSLYIWPLLNAIDGTTPEQVRITYQRRIEDAEDLDEDVDIRQQYLDVVGYNLAARLADSYGRAGGHIDRIVARAEILKQEMLDDDRGDFVQFVPDMTGYHA